MPQPGVVINGFIAIDKFPKDAAVNYYFLTHAHSDHYGALDNKWNNGTIYCSPITAHVLPIVTQRPRSKRGGIQSHLIHALDLNIWHYMDGFSVMLLDANHVPGSVMFLFEGDRISNGRILFTGDFRADVRFYQNVFAISVLQEMSLNTIYLDTTYINCTREEFPSREASSAEICSVVRELLFDGSKPVTIIVPKIGREQLLVDVAIKFKCKIWVDYIRFQIAEILGLNEYFTTEKAETSIWTCTRHDERMHCVEYSDHSSPNEIRSFLSQLSFSQIIGLSIQLSQKQTEELERLSLMGFTDILIRTENDESIAENELNGLASSTVWSRIGLANDHALRNVFDVEILQDTANCGRNQKLNAADESGLEIDEENIGSTETILGVHMPVKNLQNTRSLSETVAKSDEKLQKIEKETKKDTKNSSEAVDDVDDYIFNLAMRKITRADYTNLTTRICMELNSNENTVEYNPLHEFWNEVDFSKEVENLDNLSEKYREAVNVVAKMQPVHDVNLPYNAQENVTYDISRAPVSIDIPLEWLNGSGLRKSVVII
ncbi:unnamed protein product [Cercopithifilaria johnstoni]|uniref:Uncharacterized protein n=1 Tax=Cercopithifilaria johnstoni TaxID=2874296 RepID=A0A8J2MBL3_9BILA|nr:unnamed protein product [Cercopithifilaria johnstoni]